MNKYQKGLAPIVITLIVLILASAGGISYYLINKQPKLSNNQNQQSSETNDNIDIDDWKTYTNSDIGFEIKYPSNWDSPFENWGPGFTAGTSVDNNNYCVTDVAGWSGSNDAEIADLIGKGYSKTLIKIDGMDGIRLTRNSSEAGLAEAVYFETNDKSFRIGRNKGTGNKIEQDCIKNFNQSLSTFKLTKEEGGIDETANWKTYTEEQYGYEIKYPSLYNAIGSNTQMAKVTIGTEVAPAYTIYYEKNLNNISSLENLKSSMEESLRELAPANLKIAWKNIIISNEEAVEMSYESFAGGYTGTAHETAIIKDNTGYIIKIASNGSEKEYYQILSTFKFTK